MRSNENRSEFKKRVSGISFVLALTIFFCIQTSISTTSSKVDWLFIAILYLCISIVLFWAHYQKKGIVSYLGRHAMLPVFGVGYILGTIGFMVIGMVVAHNTVDAEIWLSKNLIYKESRLGHATSDYRGKKVEIYRTISWLPLLEWRIINKDYWLGAESGAPVEVLTEPLSIKLSEDASQLFVAAHHPSNERSVPKVWADTLHISK